MKAVGLVLSFSVVLAYSARASIITVNDAGDSTGGRGCTLRDAIAAANTDTTQGGCVSGSGADTIEFTLATPARVTLTSNTELVINEDITINGPGATALTIDGNGRHGGSRVFEIANGTANISNLTIKDGNAGSAFGGGILVDSGATLNLNNCDV